MCDGLQTVIMETIHSFGLAVFLWKVLPVLTIVEASVIFAAVGVVPSLLHIFNRKSGGAKITRIILLVLDVLASLLQVAGLIVLSILINKKYGEL